MIHGYKEINIWPSPTLVLHVTEPASRHHLFLCELILHCSIYMYIICVTIWKRIESVCNVGHQLCVS
jgi:hypothetical protein